jgi:ribosomal silencing factor RsfS
VIDFFDVIVHVMRKEVRERYDLESLWGDAARVKPPAARKKAVSKKA